MGKTIKKSSKTTQSRKEMIKNLGKRHKNDDIPNPKRLDDVKHHLKATRNMDRFYGKTRINSIPDEVHHGRQKI